MVLELQEIVTPYLVTVSTDAHEEVIWLYVSVDEVLCVHILDSADHLVIKKKGRIRNTFRISGAPKLWAHS